MVKLNSMKKNYFLFIIAAFCLVGFLTLVFIVLFRSPTILQKNTLKPSIEPNHSSESTLKFKSGTQGKLYEKLTGKRVLSDSDRLIRSQIISEIGSKSGTLYLSSNILLGYLSSPDYFQAEIKTTNDEIAKTEAVNWFLSKGISRSGICDLPIMFILDENVFRYFIESKKEFNPLAPGC